ncbi:Methyltransferase domain-containing protein [Phyllobacterium sp. CL33Tsu]|uniref:class I SAM-dependent methyltransferase n=1 Tax=Phyllobacterium sp. CL33Tsu TaxID=1798191 RepID=UPI0008E5F2CD|nr:class I SAM-dependent methyltransferase [Phyllobacterium sp. CL33Tsu]SFJ09641.1 Methyltransferase domain-containing protein [Phyllobacterium sp. CL33Tsu]
MALESAANVTEIYKKRFIETGLAKRDRVWKTLCSSYFNDLVVADGSILDLACGYGEFINNINVREKYAVDLNPDAAEHLLPTVSFTPSMADDLGHLPSDSLDRAFTSNFLEHLPDKKVCDAVLKEILRVLKPGGRFIIMGPNIRYAYKEYWDFYDHYLPLSDVSLAEGLAMNGYKVVSVTDRFLPFTMANKQPTHDLLIKAYLRMPFFWRFFGKQFLVVAEKP